MARLSTKLKGFVFLYVFFPTFILLLILNGLFWRSINNEHRLKMVSLRESISLHFVQELEQSLASLAMFASLPPGTELVVNHLENYPDVSSPLSETELNHQLEVFSDAGTQPAEEVLTKQEFINNPVADAFRKLAGRHPEFTDFVLVDHQGRAVSGSTAGLMSNYESADWWRQLLEQKDPRLFFEGVREDNSFGVYALLYDRNGNTKGGIRFEVKFEAISQRMQSDVFPDNTAAVIAHQFSQFMINGSKLTDEDTLPAVMRIRSSSADEGYHRGVYFTGYRMPNGNRFSNQPYLLVFNKGSIMATERGKQFGLSIFVSLVLLGAIVGLANYAKNKLIQNTQTQVDAGAWLLHQMRGEGSFPSSTYAHIINTPLHKEITSWQSGYVQSIRDDVESVSHENRQDLQLARDFQMAYLSRPFPRIPTLQSPGRLRLKFNFSYKPALAIGGDFFEVIPLTPETGGVLISDVMGHGTRSALVSNILRTLINDLRPQGANARNLMRELNRSFFNAIQALDLEFPLFASACYMVFDMTARAATYSTAGHPCPYHLRRSQNTVESLKVSEPHGAALGIAPSEDYTGGSCRFSAGDVFVFFTDGLYEAFNHSGDEFGLNMIEKNLRRLMHRNGKEIVRGLVEAVEDFTGGTVLHDDICLLVVEVEEDVIGKSPTE